MNGKMMKVSFVSEAFKVNEKIELKVEVDSLDKALNVYDEKDVDLTINFTSSNGKNIILPGFYFEDYGFSNEGILTARTNEKGDFRFRAALCEAGDWAFTIVLKIKGQTMDTVEGRLTVEKNKENRGFLSVEPRRKQNFVFSDGTPYVAIGENTAFVALPDTNARGAQLLDWMKKCSDCGANFVRLWLIYWGLNIQKTELAPNDFSGGLAEAAQLDRIFDAWHQNGMYGQFCIYSFNHLNNKEGSPEAAWRLFPYNVNNKNGYLEKPMDFFTNKKAIADTKTFLRYLVARYSYSVNLHSWEFFNEADGASGSRLQPNVVVEWHKNMTEYLRSIDPYNHMITTSTACRPSNANKNDTELKNTLNAQDFFDFASIHYYNYEKIEDLSDYLLIYQGLYSRPVVYGECGLTELHLDKDFINFHQQNWLGVMANGAGTSATWYWEWLDKYDGYHLYKPLSEFVKEIPWTDENLSSLSIADSNLNSEKVKCLGYSSNDFAGFWLYDTLFTQTTKTERTISDLKIDINLSDGEYCVKWINTWTGETIAESQENAVSGVLALSVPNWCRDVAAIVTKKHSK